MESCVIDIVKGWTIRGSIFISNSMASSVRSSAEIMMGNILFYILSIASLLQPLNPFVNRVDLPSILPRESYTLLTTTPKNKSII